VAAARAVKYVGAGTVEFIVEQGSPELSEAADLSAAGPSQGAKAPSGGSAARKAAGVGAFYFMEMNTRLQVEHPVTEAITGQDLVEWQLRVAAGEPLPLRQEDLRIHGHAIEARICAENPDNNFLPATGTLAVYRKPACASFERGPVRVDDGVREGDAISPFYDSMVAKLIVHGDTREQALARLDTALAQTRIVGLATNVQFLRHVLATRSFSQARLDTALIPREEAQLFRQEKIGLALAVAAALAQTLLHERAGEGADPFSRTDGWRAHGVATRRFDFEFQGEALTAQLQYLHDGALLLTVGETRGPLVFQAVDGGIDLRFAGQRETVQTWQKDETVHVFGARGATQIVELDALAHAGEVHAEGGRLTAPMPGKVVSFAVKAGDAVTKGQALAVMEAMKMEHTIAAPADGTVAELLYAPGDQVAEGAELLKLSTAQ
jgi:3-methylcrotonyl-CoA carboxylase alpha subunit